MLRTFDFFFRGAIVMGTLITIISNFRKIRKNRIDNENRVTIKYYNSIIQNVSIYINYISSILIGLSLFRVGSILQIKSNGEMNLSFLNFILLSNDQVLEIQNIFILIGVIGSVCYVFFSIVLNTSYLQLGKNFSIYIDIKEGNRLVKNEIYGIIRHPIYLCEVLLPLSASFALQSWILFLWSLLVLTPVIIYKAKIEDELLEHYYGNEFRDYKLNVGGFFPHLFKLK